MLKLERYLNQQIELIYLNRHGKTSKHTVRPVEIKNDQLKAYCLTSKAPQVFLISNILAVQPVVGHMLLDIERKTLRIIGNFSSVRRRPPSIEELRNKTGRNRGGIIQVLMVLNREEYIEWNMMNPDKMASGWVILSSLCFAYITTLPLLLDK